MINKEKAFVSATVYVHNCEDRIAVFLEMLRQVLESRFEHSEIICVNDASADDSAKKIKEIASADSAVSITVLNLSYFHGLEMAMNAGMDLSIGDFVFEFDNTTADFSPELIMQVFEKSLEGYDIVSAVPNRRERWSSKLFYLVYKRFAYLPNEMHTESFRVLSRRVINRIGSMNTTTPYRKAVYSSQGLKTAAIRYTVDNTASTASDRQEKKYRAGLAMDSLILFTELGYKLSLAMTLFMMIISILMILYSVVIYATSQPVAGWTTTILFLSVAFFGLFAILSFIIRYLQQIINLVFKRKHYSVESIEKLSK